MGCGYSKQLKIVKPKQNSRGFTIIELLAVLLIIGVLASIGIPRYFRVVERGRISEGLRMGRAYAGAVARFCVRSGVMPALLADLDVESGGGTRYYSDPNPQCC